MRKLGLALTCAFTFVLGIAVGRSIPLSHAAATPLLPMIINLPALTPSDLPPAPQGGTMASKTLAVADGMTLAVQRGTVGKHFHADANEIQYVVEGTGQFWLGDSYRDVKPGDLIIIPKGTVHAGTTTTFKAIAIKTPPQDPRDVHKVP